MNDISSVQTENIARFGVVVYKNIGKESFNYRAIVRCVFEPVSSADIYALSWGLDGVDGGFYSSRGTRMTPCSLYYILYLRSKFVQSKFLIHLILTSLC